MKQLYFIAIAQKSICKLLAVNFIVVLLTAVQTFAQSINGEGTPCPGTAYTYSFITSSSGPTCAVAASGWSISGGTISSSWSGGAIVV